MATRIPTELIKKYDRPGPRYTSYPTAVEFSDSFGPAEYAENLRETNQTGERPLSLYFHLPFCEKVCYFCGCNVIYTNKRDRAIPYVDHVIREMELVRPLVHADRRVTQLHWGGGTPTFLKPELMRKLMEATKRLFPFADDAEIGIEVDPREAGDEHIETLGEIGFNRLSMGVQDFAPEVQRAVNRIQPFELTADRLKKARAVGFTSVNLDLMYGLPKQTLETMSDTLERTISLRPDRIAFFNFAWLPELKKHMRRINPDEIPSPDVKLQLLEMAVNKLNEAGYRYIGMDHFALPEDELCKALDAGTLHRNFQGYTTHAEADLYGFGVTSISEIGATYSQNDKINEPYQAKVERGDFPTIRGVRLTQDDLIRRDVIMGLINRMHVDLADVGQKFGIEPAAYFEGDIAELRPFIEDGLVTVEGLHIRVTEPGRFLIRNICMTFDAYLKLAPAEKKFSRTI